MAIFGRFRDWLFGRESHSRIPSVEQTWEAAIVRLRKRIEDPSRLMKRLGMLVVGESQKAFNDQALGEIKWEHRYPNQADPVMNIAGALMDLKRGPSIKSRRFDRRPALADTGMLRRSISNSSALTMRGNNQIQVGTTREGAFVHQWGGVTKAAVTDVALWNLTQVKNEAAERMERVIGGANWVKSMRSGRKGKTRVRPSEAGREYDAIRKLDVLETVGTLVTHVNPRPFVGIPDQLAETMIKTIEDDYERNP